MVLPCRTAVPGIKMMRIILHFARIPPAMATSPTPVSWQVSPHWPSDRGWGSESNLRPILPRILINRLTVPTPLRPIPQFYCGRRRKAKAQTYCRGRARRCARLCGFRRRWFPLHDLGWRFSRVKVAAINSQIAAFVGCALK
jgi:hypothetical protein